MELSAEQRRFLWIGQAFVPFAINVVINGAIGWASFRGASSIPMWGAQSIGGDTLGTSFFLPAITCAIVTPLVRREVRRQRVKPIESALPGWLRAFRRPLLVRAIALGAACIPVAGGLGIAALAAAGVDGLGFGPFLAWKSLYAGVLAFFVTPAIALLALSDPQER